MNYSKVFFIFFLLLGASFVSAELFVNYSDINYSDGVLNVDFEMYTLVGIEPNVKYGLFLAKPVDGGVIVYDTLNPTEQISVGVNSIMRELNYTFPKQLSGEYQVWFQATNDKGMILFIDVIYNAKLNRVKEYLGINKLNCGLFIDSSENSFLLGEGVSVNSDEELSVSCVLKNNYSKEIIVYPKFETFRRTSFGEKISSVIDKNQTKIIQKNSEDTINFIIPKAGVPQAYDLVISLLSDEDIISDKIDIHYVLSGLSATIKKFEIEKYDFFSGENADINIIWTPSADSFFGSRSATEFNSGKLLIKIFGEILCVEKELQLDDWPLVTTNLSFEKDCNIKNIVLNIVGPQGQLLDTSDFNTIGADEGSVIIIDNNLPQGKIVPPVVVDFNFIIIILLIILIIAGRVIIVIKVNK